MPSQVLTASSKSISYSEDIGHDWSVVSIGGAISWPGNSLTCIVYCRARGEKVRREEGDNLDWEEGKDRQSVISQNLLEL